MKTKSLSLIGSIVLVIATAAGFFWLWNSAKSTTATTPSANLAPFEIESVKTEADNLVSEMENNANIPIPVPTGKMGRENPFAGI